MSVPELAPVLAMLELLDGPALMELKRALTGQLNEQESPAERRARRLGPLAELIAEHAPSYTSRIPRTLYDTLQPPVAPSSVELVEEYGAWVKVCRAAEGVLPDGRVRRGDRNRPRNPGIRIQTPAYSRLEITNAIRRCALRLGRRPTSRMYETWREGELRRVPAEQRPSLRVPTLATTERQFGTWAAALAATALDERALADVRAERAPALTRAAAAGVSGADVGRAQAAGINVPLTPDDALDHERALALELPEALQLAQALGCSLEHLAGVSAAAGAAPPASRFDAVRWKERMREKGIGEQALLRQVGLTLSAYRRTLSGRLEPTLLTLTRFSSVVDAPIASLLTHGETPC